MEFGKIRDLKIFEKINWSLPPEDPLAKTFLEGLPRSPTQLKVGAPAWNHTEWVGKVYPAKTKAADYLFHYSRFFNTIELNTTHYRIPRPDQTQKWISQVPKDFMFCPKIFQGISHDNKGLVDAELLKFWFLFLEELDGHCGPCFLQLPPHFDYGWKAVLFQFLKLWPDDFRLAIEFRHASWFEGGRVLPALTQYLQQRRIGLVITDVAGRRDVLHSSVSAEFTMVRFVGNSLHPSDDERAGLWNDRLSNWEFQGLKETIFFVHQPDDILVPEMTNYLGELSFFKGRFTSKTLSPDSAVLKKEGLDLFNFSNEDETN